MTHVRKTSDGGFEVRVIVPQRLRSTIGKTNLTRRLGRVSKSEANRLAAPFIQKFHARIERAKTGSVEPEQAVPVEVVQPSIAPEPQPMARKVPAAKLMQLFDGYVRERQPSPEVA